MCHFSMWLAENEGAKFWLNVLTELKNRGLNDILIACVDGLKGYFLIVIHGLTSSLDMPVSVIRVVHDALCRWR